MFIIVILFRSSSNVHVCRCDLFGQVHIFRSYSFGHVDLVKRLFLIFENNFIIFHSTYCQWIILPDTSSTLQHLYFFIFRFWHFLFNYASHRPRVHVCFCFHDGGSHTRKTLCYLLTSCLQVMPLHYGLIHATIGTFTILNKHNEIWSSHGGLVR